MALPKTFIEDGSTLIGIGVPSKEIELRLGSFKEVNEIIVKNHYSHTNPSGPVFCMLVYWKGSVHGAIQLGNGVRPDKKTGENDEVLDPAQVLEFDRMWLSDEMPKFSETIILSCLHRYLRFAYPHIHYLISYSDTTAGNPGTIYKAANYKLIQKLKADFYLTAEGERIHPITMWRRHGGRSWADVQKWYPGVVRPKGFQLKFLFDLTRGKRPLLGNKYDTKKDDIDTIQTTFNDFFN